MKKIIKNVIGSMGALNDATNNQKQSAENVSNGIHQSVNQHSLYSALLRGEKTEEVQNFVAWMNLITEKVENHKVKLTHDGNGKNYKIDKFVERDYGIYNEKSFIGDEAELNYKIINTKRDESLSEMFNRVEQGLIEEEAFKKGKIHFIDHNGSEDTQLNSEVYQCNIKTLNGIKMIDVIFKHKTFKHFKFRNYDFNKLNHITFVSDRNDHGCMAFREFSYGGLIFDRIFSVDENTTIVTLISNQYIEDVSISESTMTESVRVKYENNAPKSGGNISINGK